MLFLFKSYGPQNRRGGMSTLEKARGAKNTIRAHFISLGAEVSGVGITRISGEYGVKVNLKRAMPVGVEVPAEVDGTPVLVEVLGKITAR